MDVKHPFGVGVAINSDCTLCAVTDSAHRRVVIHPIDSAGRTQQHRLPTAVYAVADVRPTHLSKGEPTYLSFATRCGVETLLVSTDGFYGVMEITTAGVHMRDIGGNHDDSMHYYGVQYVPRKDFIAAAFVKNSGPESGRGIRIFNYASGAVVRDIKGIFCPRSIVASADGNHLFASIRAAPCIRVCIVKVRIDGDDMPRRISEAPIVCTSIMTGANVSIENMLRDASDGLVFVTLPWLHGRPGIGTTVVFMDARGMITRKVAISGGDATLAWLGDDVCCRTHDGTMHVIPDAWSTSLRAAWVTACVRK
jgi:hypothetical protein